MSGPIDSVILTYHSIDVSQSVLSTNPEMFADQMSQLAAGPYRIVPLAQIGQAPGNLAITFDDGYCNFLTAAWPVLKKLSIPPTVFIVPGECGGTNRWDAHCAAVPKLPLMDWEQLQEIGGQGVTIGAHTMTHANLTKIALADAEWEIATSQHQLQDRLQCSIEQFAYPYGASNAGVRSIVNRHFRTACGTDLGFASAPLNPLLLPRIDAYYLRSTSVFREFAMGRSKGYLAARRLLRGVRSWASL